METTPLLPGKREVSTCFGWLMFSQPDWTTFAHIFLGQSFSQLEAFLDAHPSFKSILLIAVNQDLDVIALGSNEHYHEFVKEDYRYNKIMFPLSPCRHFNAQGDCDYRYWITENPTL